MTDDEIKHLMREQWPTALLVDADVERIRNIIEAAVLAERETCANVCDKNKHFFGYQCAAAIRARSDK